MTLIEAIARREGYYVTGSRPQRNHSPGDLLWSEEAIRFGATDKDGEYAIFPDEATGFGALRKWLSIPAKFSSSGCLVGGYLGATLSQVIFRFAPPTENNSASYLSYICSQTGYTETTILTHEILTQEK